MFLVGIDTQKHKHSFCIINKETGESIVKPKFFNNNKVGFEELLFSVKGLPKKDILIGMEDTVSNVKLFKDSLVKIIGDIFDSYDSLINLFGGQCQII